jgi:hypothetical protein
MVKRATEERLCERENVRGKNGKMATMNGKTGDDNSGKDEPKREKTRGVHGGKRKVCEREDREVRGVRKLSGCGVDVCDLKRVRGFSSVLCTSFFSSVRFEQRGKEQ